MRVLASDVVREGRIRDQWPLLEAQVWGTQWSGGLHVKLDVAYANTPRPSDADALLHQHNLSCCPAGSFACLQTGECHLSLEWNPVKLDEGPTTH